MNAPEYLPLQFTFWLDSAGNGFAFDLRQCCDAVCSNFMILGDK